MYRRTVQYERSGPMAGSAFTARGQVVVVQLVGPVLVVVVLLRQDAGPCSAASDTLPQSLRTARRKTPHGIVLLAPRGVVPALDGGGREMDLASA